MRFLKFAERLWLACLRVGTPRLTMEDFEVWMELPGGERRRVTGVDFVIDGETQRDMIVISAHER